MEVDQDMDNTEHLAMNMIFIKPQTPNFAKTVRHVAPGGPNKPSLYQYTRRAAKYFEEWMELRVCPGINNSYRQYVERYHPSKVQSLDRATNTNPPAKYYTTTEWILHAFTQQVYEYSKRKELVCNNESFNRTLLNM